MPISLDHYTRDAADWRETLRINNRKTNFVIGLFVLIYLSLGLLVDLAVCSSHFPDVSLPILLKALVTLQIFPVATLVMLAVAIVSLLVTFAFHDQLMLLGTEYREITPATCQSAEDLQLYNIVEEMKIAAGLQFIPRVFVIDADYMNAFASGYSERSAMIAITRGLLGRLNRSECQAVIAHELSHIRHMDIRLTLMASVLANLMVMVLDMLFYNLLFANRRSDEREGNGALFAIILVVRWLLPVINLILILYLSRTREYMADAGSVELLRDNQPLASALLKIQQDHEAHAQAFKTAYQSTPHENVRREAYIFDPIQAGFEHTGSLTDLFSTHPSIDARLRAIGFRQKS